MLKEKAGVLVPTKITTSKPKAKESVCSVMPVLTVAGGAGQSAGAVPKCLRRALYPQKKCLRMVCSLRYINLVNIVKGIAEKNKFL